MTERNPDAKSYIQRTLEGYGVPADVVARITAIVNDALASYQSLHTRYTARLAEQLEEYKLRANAAEAVAAKQIAAHMADDEAGLSADFIEQQRAKRKKKKGAE